MRTNISISSCNIRWSGNPNIPSVNHPSKIRRRYVPSMTMPEIPSKNKKGVAFFSFRLSLPVTIVVSRRIRRICKAVG